jgi:hypothetical protein
MATFGYIDFSTKTGGIDLSAVVCDIGEIVKHPGFPNDEPVVTATGRLRAGTGNETEAWFFKCPPPSADHSVAGMFTRLDGDGVIDIWARFRKIGSNLQGYAARWYQGTWYVYRWHENGATSLGAYVDAFGTGQQRTAKLEVSGTGATVTVNLYIGGVLVITAGDTDANRVTDTGVVGFTFYSLDTIGDTHGMQLDSVRAGEGATIDLPPLLICEGDSEMASTGLATAVSAAMSHDHDFVMIATPGEKLSAMIGQVNTQVEPLVHNLIPTVVVLLLGGTNDYDFDTATGATVYGRLTSYADAVHPVHDDVRLIVCTIPHRNYAGDRADINDDIDDGDVLTLANGDGKFEQVWDLPATIGSDPATYTNDGLHLTAGAVATLAPVGAAIIDAEFTSISIGPGSIGGGFFGPGRFN